MGFCFEIWAGIPLFRAVAPVRALTGSDVEWSGRGQEEGRLLWRGRGIGFLIWAGVSLFLAVTLVRVVRLVWRGVGINFGIWAGIPLFCAVDSVRAVAEGVVG